VLLLLVVVVLCIRRGVAEDALHVCLLPDRYFRAPPAAPTPGA